MLVEKPLGLVLGIFDTLSEVHSLAFLEGEGPDGSVPDSAIEELVTVVFIINLAVVTPCVQVKKLMTGNRIGVA